MKIVTNPKKINRYYKIGMYTSLGSLIFLFAAVGLTLTFNAEYSNYSFLAMLVGLVLSQVGVHFSNRYGKSPRIDERITQGLKGLDDRYTLYHYVTPVPHLLLGPSGVWVIEGLYQPGTITFENGRYKQRGIGFFSRFIGQESIGRPELEVQNHQQDIVKFLKQSMPENETFPIQPVIVFTSPKATVQAQEAPIPTMHVEKLKDFFRRKLKEQPANPQLVRKIQDLLPEGEVED